MNPNPLKPGDQTTSSQDSIKKYSRPYPLEENKKSDSQSQSQSLKVEEYLPLEENNTQNLLQRLQEAQNTSIQNRRNLLNELNKEKKNLGEAAIDLKQDDLVQFFTNNGELKTLNEENLVEVEKEMDKNFKKKKDIFDPPKKLFPEPCEDIGLEEKAFSNGKKTIPTLDVKPSMQNNSRKVQMHFQKTLEPVEGWLKKKSPHRLQGWQSRYCRVSDRKFFYYRKKDLENPMGVLDFDIVTVVLSEIKENGALTGFIFIFKKKDKKEKEEPKMEIWFQILQNHISKSIGATKKMDNLAKVPRFWRDIRISEAKFKSKADTLDVLLFRGKNITSKFQRSFTGSHYDHVALILRYGNNELVLLEATGREGVGLCSWSCFMRNKWQNLYKKLVLRHLEVQRTDKMIETLEKFVKQVIGKKFSVNLKKLLKKKSENLDLDSNKAFENKTFFCSELVASAYKVMGILPEDVASSQYYPGYFSKEKKLNLRNGAKLTEEYLIDFTL